MKAAAVTPRQPHSLHLVDVPRPKVTDVPPGLKIRQGHGVLVKVLKVGVDATDREINDALYGNAPPGEKHLVLGHESFGRVEEVDNNVKNVKPGDYVTASPRRKSISNGCSATSCSSVRSTPTASILKAASATSPLAT